MSEFVDWGPVVCSVAGRLFSVESSLPHYSRFPHGPGTPSLLNCPYSRVLRDVDVRSLRPPHSRRFGRPLVVLIYQTSTESVAWTLQLVVRPTGLIRNPGAVGITRCRVLETLAAILVLFIFLVDMMNSLGVAG